jgi:transposase
MKEKVAMNVVNPKAAGIDVGSRSHFVSIGQQPNDVREFGVYSSDHHDMIMWLKDSGVTTVAMESTGNYWQTLFSALQLAGFELLLVNGRQIKNVKGKTDVKDCQWIQKLHCLGLLSGSFLPSTEVEQLRNYERHRSWLVEECAKMSNKMQKVLRLMNIRLDVALSDITGKSGMAIIKAILDGERSGDKLLLLVDGRVKKSKEEISKALQGQWDKGFLFELKNCYELYHNIQSRIDACDKEEEELLKEFVSRRKDDNMDTPKLSVKHKRLKNQHTFDVAAYCQQYTGVDLFAIKGVKHQTVMTYLSEVGMDIFKFRSSKAFVCWLRLAPNNKISGGKTLSSRTPKGKNKLAIALRNAANSVGLMKEGSLKRFFDRIAYKKGRAAAVTATARKLAVIIWNMVVRQTPYKPIDENLYNERIRKAIIQNIKKKMNRMNLNINDLMTPQEIS